MDVTFTTDCPHCYSNAMTFSLAGIFDQRELEKAYVFTCNGCLRLLVIHASANTTRWASSWVGDFKKGLVHHGGQLKTIYPGAQPRSTPEFIPEAVEKAFTQGVDNAHRKNNGAAAAMFRKSIEVATRRLNPELAGKTLAKRIDLLREKDLLTSDLKEWAHLIRLDGNAGVHEDDDPSDAEVAQLESFTDLFLRYTFTLPAQVAARKEAAEAADSAD